MSDILSEDIIEYYSTLCFEEEADEDYPTDEEIAEIMAEIYGSEEYDSDRN